MSRKDLASKAAAEALRVRLRAGLGLTDPASPIDIVERLGVQVWFQQLPSAEGMLIRAPHPVILLSSLRPAGRIGFTCAHELGHFWFEHPGQVDVVDDGPVLKEESDDEYQANMFAAYLLMPKTLVQNGFVRRGTTPESAAPLSVLAIAHWLGVGYSTLVHHLRFNLNLISDSRRLELLRHSPKDLVGPLLGQHRSTTKAAVVVDREWRARPVDIEVGDVIILDHPAAASGTCLGLEPLQSGKSLVVGVRPGTGHLESGSGWSTYVRVRRSHFEGRSIFRHLEEPEDE